MDVLREAAAEGLELVCSSCQSGYAHVAVMRGGQFAAQLYVPGAGPGGPVKCIWLGTHPTAEEAALFVARCRRAHGLHGQASAPASLHNGAPPRLGRGSGMAQRLAQTFRHHTLSEAAAARLPAPAAPAGGPARPWVRLSAGGGTTAVVLHSPPGRPHCSRGRKSARAAPATASRGGSAGAGADAAVGAGGAGASRPTRGAAGRAQLFLSAALKHDALQSDEEEEEEHDEEEEDDEYDDDEYEEEYDEEGESEEDEEDKALAVAEAEAPCGSGRAPAAVNRGGGEVTETEEVAAAQTWEEVEVEVEVVEVEVEAGAEVGLEVEVEAVEVDCEVVVLEAVVV